MHTLVLLAHIVFLAWILRFGSDHWIATSDFSFMLFRPDLDTQEIRYWAWHEQRLKYAKAPTDALNT
jgi:hypothetical protein